MCAQPVVLASGKPVGGGVLVVLEVVVLLGLVVVVDVGEVVVVTGGVVVVTGGVVLVGDGLAVTVTVDVTVDVTGAGFGHEQVTRIDCDVAPSVIVGDAVHDAVGLDVAAMTTTGTLAVSATTAPIARALRRMTRIHATGTVIVGTPRSTLTPVVIVVDPSCMSPPPPVAVTVPSRTAVPPDCLSRK